MDNRDQYLNAWNRDFYFLVGALIAQWNETEIALRYVLEAMTGLDSNPTLATSLLRHIGNRSLLDTIEDLAKEREDDEALRDYIVRLCRFAEACRINRNHITHARAPFEWEAEIDALILEPDQRSKRQRQFMVTNEQLRTCIGDTKRCFDQALNLFYFYFFRDDKNEADDWRQTLDLELAPPALLMSNPQTPQ